MEPIKDILPKISLKANGISGGHSAEPEDVCPICRGAGVLHPVGEDGRPQYYQTVPCECSRERVLKERYAQMLNHCQLPAATNGWTFETFEASGPLQEAYNVALQLAEERDDVKWLTLVGPVDTGKSHLAVAICRRWLARPWPTR